jgi:hypothetical protein
MGSNAELYFTDNAFNNSASNSDNVASPGTMISKKIIKYVKGSDGGRIRSIIPDIKRKA